MSEQHFVLTQFFKRGDNSGLSKFHIFAMEDGEVSKQSICGARPKRRVTDRFCQPIEWILRAAARRAKNYNNKQLCKHCKNRAQKFRNPLERLSEIEASE